MFKGGEGGGGTRQSTRRRWGDADVATEVVEVHDNGGDSADVATKTGAVHDDRVVGDVACRGAANR